MAHSSRFVPVLHRYVVRDLSGTLLLAFSIVMGLMFLFLALEAARRAGMEISSLLVLAPHAVPFGLKYALPVSLLLAVTFTFSRLAADNEITALRAAGSSLWLLVAPVILVALLLSLALLAVTMVWLPRAHVAKRSILRAAGLNVLENLPPGEQQFRFGRVRLAYRDARGQVLSDVYVSEVKDGGLRRKIMAKEGRWKFDRASNVLTIVLKHAQATELGGKEGMDQKVDSEEVPFRLDLENLYPSRPKRTEDYSLSQILGLRGLVRDLSPHVQHRIFRWSPEELEFELHSRFAGALSPLIMVLLGMPLGVWVRQRGRLTAFFVGFIPVMCFYYPLTLIGQGLGTEGRLAPAVAAWGAAVIVGLAGAFLTWRMMFR